MVRKALCAMSLSVGLTLLAGASAAVAKQAPAFTPGAPGAGDPYFPLDGNGGYDVRRYILDIAYDPPTNTLTGVATIARDRRRTCRRSTSTSWAGTSAPSSSTGGARRGGATARS